MPKQEMLFYDEQKIVVPHSQMQNVRVYVLNQVEGIKGTCDETHGYVSDVKDIKILGNTIIDEGILIVVKITLETFLPKEGDIVNGVIDDIYEEGMSISTTENLNVHIPIENIHRKKHPRIDDEVKVKLVCVKYDRGTFSCIGEID